MEQRDVQADTTAGQEAEMLAPPCENRGLPQVAPGGPLPLVRVRAAGGQPVCITRVNHSSGTGDVGRLLSHGPACGAPVDRSRHPPTGRHAHLR